MTSLDQASESQHDTNEQHTMDQHSGERAGWNGEPEERADEAPSTDEQVAGENSGADPSSPPDAGEPIAAEHPTEDQSREDHSASSFSAHHDIAPASSQTPPHSAETSTGEIQDSGETKTKNGVVSDLEGPDAETGGGTDKPSAEVTEVLMEDRTTEGPEDALGQEAPGADAGNPASAELAEADHVGREPEEQGDAEGLNVDSGADSIVTTGESMDGQTLPGAPVGEPAHDGKFMQTFFEDLLRALGVQGSIVVREDNQDEVTLDIRSCPDASLIIGRHGQTVDDLQYLGSLVLNNNRRDRRRFMLNVENYRERREESLRQSAITLAHQVAELGQEAVLDPLPPHERRIVHMALVDITEVYTYSEGVEPDRRIVISPRNFRGTSDPDEGGENLNESAQEENTTPWEGAEGSGENVNSNDAGVLNEAFGETDSLTQQVERDPTEFGLADEEPASGEGGDPASQNSYELDGDEPTLPESPPGGGSHGGHTGED